MGIKFVDGVMVMEDADANACPTDPDELNQCEGCS